MGWVSDSMRSHAIISLLLIWGAAPALASEEHSIFGLPKDVAVRLGDSIHLVVFELGPPDRTLLAGQEDGYYTPSPSDALVLSWDVRDCQFGRQACRYNAVFASGSAALTRFTVGFVQERSLLVEDVREIVGNLGRVFRFPLVCDSGEIECGFGVCSSDAGEVTKLIAPSFGLDTYLRGNGGTVELLEFSVERQQAGWPEPCEP